jgi:hypothetical protein
MWCEYDDILALELFTCYDAIQICARYDVFYRDQYRAGVDLVP